MRLVLLGPPGAGKGTQALTIVEKWNVRHFSTGEALRGQVKAGTKLGKEAQSYITKGELVPTELITQIVIDGLDQEESKQSGWMLDGFPRNLNQAGILDDYLKDKEKKLDAVIDICLDDAVIVDRLTGRRFCPECGWSCNLTSMPPKIQNRCDQCNAELQQRDDDRIETIRHRLEVYHEVTQPLEDFYESKGELRRIRGEGSPEEIFARIEVVLQDL